MGKVLIVSDSHGLTKELHVLKNRHHDADIMIHCGDSELDATQEEMKNFVAVRGNCDFDTRFQEDIVQKVDGFTFFVTHGHLYSVKSSLMNLKYRAEEFGAQIVCFGHSHELGAEMLDGTLFINPGSLRLPRNRPERTYVVLDLQKKQIELHVIDFDKGELLDLKQVFPL